MNDKNKQEPVKATPEQIDRWAEIRDAAMKKRHEHMTEEMAKRHDLEIKKATDAGDDRTINALNDRHAKDIDALATRISQDTERFEAQVQVAHESTIIPDKEHAPTHTKEQIDDWIIERREQLASEHKRELAELYERHRPLIKSAEDEHHKAWVNAREQMQKEHDDEYESLSAKIERARETGRIPDPPTHTKEEIRVWAKEYAAELQRHQDEYIAGLHEQFTGDELQKRLNLAEYVHHNQAAAMQDTIFTAYDEGRIPDQGTEHEINRGMEP